MSRIISAIRWPFAVTRQWLSNIATVTRQASPRHVVPPWVWDRVWTTLGWFKTQFKSATGYRVTPYEQMVGAASVIALMVISSPLSAGAKLLLLPIPIMLLLIGAARLHPVVNRLWPFAETRGPV